MSPCLPQVRQRTHTEAKAYTVWPVFPLWILGWRSTEAGVCMTLLTSQAEAVRGDHVGLLPWPQGPVGSHCLGTGTSYLSLEAVEAWKTQAHMQECSGPQRSWTNWSGCPSHRIQSGCPSGSSAITEHKRFVSQCASHEASSISLHLLSG